MQQIRLRSRKPLSCNISNTHVDSYIDSKSKSNLFIEALRGSN